MSSKNNYAFNGIDGDGLPKNIDGNVKMTSVTPASNYGTNYAVPDKEKNEKDEKKEEEEDEDEEEGQRMTGVIELFRFADYWDVLMISIGSVAAAANGASMPCVLILMGKMIDLFVATGILDNMLDSATDWMDSRNVTKKWIFKDTRRILPLCPDVYQYYNGTIFCAFDLDDRIFDKMTEYAIWFCGIGVAVLIAAYFQVTMYMLAAERQTHRIRKEYLRNIMRQSIGWFDVHEAAELSTRLADDISKVQDGLGDKFGSFIQWSCCFIAGFTVGFANGWKMTLVILSVSPLMAIAATLLSWLSASMTTKELKAYAKAGAIAEEVFGAIRTVVAFGGQDKEAERYKSNLGQAQKHGVKKGMVNGMAMGFIWFVIFGCYALGFWYGGKLVREDDDYEVGDMTIVFFGVMIGAFSLGSAAPSIQTIATGRGAAFVIYRMIDMKSDIDSSSEEGKRPTKLTGTIEFRNVHFSYPSRPDVKVLSGLSMEAKPGQTVALVGSSGCGKSTTVQLLLRFYDPSSGQVMIDGTNIKELNIKWLRRNIGLVSQEPVLFATTIAENIRYGREDVTMDEIIQATKNANAYDFIMKLPDKFDTLVGERGAQLSGGQKQRVAIARALVRDPKILLLDEATSALDTESEAVVQDALDKARAGRTTIVIAHRLSTIKTADIIIGLEKGNLKEKGTHEELMEKGGIYHTLVTTQTAMKAQEAEEELEEDLGAPKPEKVLHKKLSSKELRRKSSFLASLLTEEEELTNTPFIRLLKINWPEWRFILLGCFGSIVNGGLQPAMVVICNQIIKAFAEDEHEQKKQIDKYSLILLGLGVVSLFTMFLQSYMFGCSGEALTSRLRDRCFRSMLKQDISWYDNAKNSVGALTTRLATDASLVQGVTGTRLGTIMMNFANIGTSIIVAFINGWKLSFVVLAFVPLMALGGLMQVRLLAGQAGKNKEALEGAGKIAVESIDNIRIVASLTKEPTFFQLYIDSLMYPYKESMKRAHLVGFSYALSQSVIYFSYAAVFIYGAHLIEETEMTFDEVFLVFGALMMGAMAMGTASAIAPDVGKAQTSAKRIIHLIDTEPSLDYTSQEGSKIAEPYNADVGFKDVHFRYPTRPTVPVLQGLTFAVNTGQTLALVGTSGCGKSTSVQLIERFYNTLSGNVLLGGQELKSLNIQWLRSQIGIVSQEPVLFDRSIAQNIAYGDNTRDVQMSEIIQAAKEANIHDFISNLPLGYDTNVGSKGTQLSGGQKQRVAIARALVRNPKVLLLDEATSALDTESEKVVQDALDKAREGRTCVVVAHRLSTIKNADIICVVHQGRVAEKGTHRELMNKQGLYYKLVMTSQRQP